MIQSKALYKVTHMFSPAFQSFRGSPGLKIDPTQRFFMIISVFVSYLFMLISKFLCQINFEPRRASERLKKWAKHMANPVFEWRKAQ